MAAVLNLPRRIVKTDAGVNVGAISSLEGQVRDDKTRIMTTQEIQTLQSKTETVMQNMTLVELLDIGLLQETWECLRYEVAKSSHNSQLQAKPYPTPASPPINTCWIGKHTKESAGKVVTRADQEYTFLGYTRVHLRRFDRAGHTRLDSSNHCSLIKRHYAGDVPGIIYYKASMHVTGHVLTCFLTRPADFIRQKIGKEGVVNLGDEWEVSHLCHNPCCVKPDHLILERHRLNMLRQGCLSTTALSCVCTPLHGTHNHSVCATYHPDAVTPCFLPAVYDVRLNPSFVDNYKVRPNPRRSPRKDKKRKDTDQKSDEDEEHMNSKDPGKPDASAKRQLLKPA